MFRNGSGAGKDFWHSLTTWSKHFAHAAQAWEQQFSSAGLDGFFKPCAYLEEHAASGQDLSAGVSATSRL